MIHSNAFYKLIFDAWNRVEQTHWECSSETSTIRAHGPKGTIFLRRYFIHETEVFSFMALNRNDEVIDELISIEPYPSDSLTTERDIPAEIHGDYKWAKTGYVNVREEDGAFLRAKALLPMLFHRARLIATKGETVLPELLPILKPQD